MSCRASVKTDYKRAQREKFSPISKTNHHINMFFAIASMSNYLVNNLYMSI